MHAISYLRLMMGHQFSFLVETLQTKDSPGSFSKINKIKILTKKKVSC